MLVISSSNDFFNVNIGTDSTVGILGKFLGQFYGLKGLRRHYYTPTWPQNAGNPTFKDLNFKPFPVEDAHVFNPYDRPDHNTGNSLP